MRPLRILRFIPDRFGGGQEIEIADGITRLALYAEHGRYAVSRLVGGEWKLVGERLSQAAVEAYLPPGWTFGKLAILIDGWQQGQMTGLQDILQRGAHRVHGLPPSAPARVKFKLLVERLATPFRVYLSRFMPEREVQPGADVTVPQGYWRDRFAQAVPEQKRSARIEE